MAKDTIPRRRGGKIWIVLLLLVLPLVIIGVAVLFWGWNLGMDTAEQPEVVLPPNFEDVTPVPPGD